MSGSGWAYAARATLWGLFVMVTFGLALPWREAALERYKMRHSFYGDLQGSFEGRGSEFFKRGWWLWLLAPVRSRGHLQRRCSGSFQPCCRMPSATSWRLFRCGL